MDVEACKESIPKRVKTEKRQFADSFLGLFLGRKSAHPNIAQIRNLITGSCVASRDFQDILGYRTAQFDPTCSKLLLQRHTGSCTLWDFKADTVSTNEGQIRSFVFNHRGNQYLDVPSQTVREADSGKEVGHYVRLKPTEDNPRPQFHGNCCFSGDDTKVIFAYAHTYVNYRRDMTDTPSIIVWEIATGEALLKFGEHRLENVFVNCPIDREVVVSVDNCDMFVWNLNDGSILLRAELALINVCNLVLCRSINAVCIQHEKGLSVLDVNTGDVISQCNKHSSTWQHLTYSEGENVLIQGAFNGARVVDASSGKILFVTEFDFRVERLQAIGCPQSSQVVLL